MAFSYNREWRIHFLCIFRLCLLWLKYCNELKTNSLSGKYICKKFEAKKNTRLKHNTCEQSVILIAINIFFVLFSQATLTSMDQYEICRFVSWFCRLFFDWKSWSFISKYRMLLSQIQFSSCISKPCFKRQTNDFDTPSAIDVPDIWLIVVIVSIVCLFEHHSMFGSISLPSSFYRRQRQTATTCIEASPLHKLLLV